VPLAFLVNQQADGVFTVRHTAADDLRADNQASVVSQLPRPVRVLLVTRGNRFLEKALRTGGDVELSLAADLADEAAAWDFVVLDGVTPASWPAGNVLAIGVAAPDWFERVGTVRAPPILDWRTTHPLLRAVNLDNVRISEGLAVPAPRWGSVLVDSTSGPLVVAGERGRQRVIWVGFDVLNSDWPLRVSFPMFVANAVDWLNPASARAARLNLRAGDPLRVELPGAVGQLDVRPPGGEWMSVPVTDATGEGVFGGTDRQGIYGVRWGTNETAVAVRALDLRESENSPRDEVKFGRFGGAAATLMRSANLEIWRWFAAAAAAVLLFEWWYYHRRTA
jgi:hypothetical protein